MGMAMTHHFNPEVAARLGINQAIILYNLGYLQTQRAIQGGDEYFFEGRWWVRHSYQTLSKWHIHLSVDQMKRVMKPLIEAGHVVTRHPEYFNRTTYWSVAPEFLHDAESHHPSGEIALSEGAKSHDVLHDNNIEHIYTRASMFDAWWKLYPRKAGKKRARKLFEKLSSSDLKDCLADNASLRYKGRSKEHIPQADTYLSQNKWEDEQDHASAQPKQRWL